jgi:hypothetical protein
LAEAPDSRDKYGRKFSLRFIIFFSILAILSVGETYKDIFLFIKEHFLELKKIFRLNWNAPPVRSTIWKIITKIDGESLEKAFTKTNMSELPKTGLFICVDGKTLRGSASKIKGIKALRVFEGFDMVDQIVIDHTPLTSDKVNYVKDVTFREDSTTKRVRPQNFSVLIGLAMNLLRRKGEKNIRSARYACVYKFGKILDFYDIGKHDEASHEDYVYTVHEILAKRREPP